ncbi:MAG: Alpha/beta fold family hydrolase, membrane associated protein [Oscillospiraceae bacterium]|jgi:triacylglycerol lipase
MRSNKNVTEKLIYWINILLICVCANSFYLAKRCPALIPVLAVGFIFSNISPIYSSNDFPNKKIKICNHGTKCLKIFSLSLVISITYHLLLFYLFPTQRAQWILSAVICICVEAIIFWNGIISVYCSSVQLGIKLRLLGLVFGVIPVAHLFMLWKIIHITSEEVRFETEKYRINMARHDQLICKTKYPILLVHGVFFRDYKYFNYWGRIPKELEENGAQIYYGEHQSAASVKASAAELAERIKQIIRETGCEKVNIIAHSKGGLDCRYAIEHTDIAPYVASLTTINTPHRGCKFADYLLNKLPMSAQQRIADTYNTVLRKFGDKNPDFMVAVRDLTSERCMIFDQTTPVPKNIVCNSVGSKLNHATNGKFPLNFSYYLVNHFDGPNDGLVGEQSFRWGKNYTFLTVDGKRGISHGDMIDLNRENIAGFDVREFYVKLVHNLKLQGL